MNINNLPDCVLVNILGKVGDTQTTAAVCQRFYTLEVIRSSGKMRFYITDAAMDEKSIRQSILSSERDCSDIVIQSSTAKNASFVTFLKEVLALHGRTVKNAILFFDEAVKEVDLLEVLNLMPNLDTLNINLGEVIPTRATKRAKLSLDLKFLEHFILGWCSSSAISFFAKNLVQDTVKSLLARFGLDEDDYHQAFSELIGSLGSLKHIRSYMDYSYLKHLAPLQLETLIIDTLFDDMELNEDTTVDTIALLVGQQHLKVLVFGYNTIIQDDMFMAISSIPTLTHLTIRVDGITPGLITRLYELKDLIALKVFSDQEEVVLKLSFLKIESLWKLDISTLAGLAQPVKDRFAENFAGAEIDYEVRGDEAEIEDEADSGDEDQEDDEDQEEIAIHGEDEADNGGDEADLGEEGIAEGED